MLNATNLHRYVKKPVILHVAPRRRTTHTETREAGRLLERLLTTLVVIVLGVGLAAAVRVGSRALADALRPLHVVAEANRELSR